MPADVSAKPARSYLLASIFGLAAAASMAMLWAVVAMRGIAFAWVMPLLTATAVVFALGLHGVRGNLSAAAIAAVLTAFATTAALVLTIGLRMAINFRMPLLDVLQTMGVEMIWALWRAHQNGLSDGMTLAGVVLAAWLAGRRPKR